jgi:hypothetical protein
MKKIFFGLFICLFAINANAQNTYNSSGRLIPRKQEKKQGYDPDKLVIGGDFRFGLGTQLSLGVAPIIGYKLKENLYAGVRLGFNYNRVKYDYNQLPSYATKNVYNYNCYSGSLWARYLIMQSLYIHAEFQYNIYNDFYANDVAAKIETKYTTSPSALIGIGFRQPISDRASFNTTILYDVLNDPYSYYSYFMGNSLDFRFGILVGF